LHNSCSQSGTTLDPARVWGARGRARTETARREMPLPTTSEAKECCRGARLEIGTAWLFVDSGSVKGTSTSHSWLLPKDIQGRSSCVCLLLGCWQVNAHGPCVSSPHLLSMRRTIHCTAHFRDFRHVVRVIVSLFKVHSAYSCESALYLRQTRQYLSRSNRLSVLSTISGPETIVLLCSENVAPDLRREG
jgi:hypothetical protein